MEETKVQLESKEDLEYLRAEFAKYVKEQGIPEGDHEFVERVFAIIRENVQIDGHDWEDDKEAVEGKPESEEPIDEELEAKLQGLQEEVDNILAKVARYRREYPKQAKQMLQSQLVEIRQQLERLPQPSVTQTLIAQSLSRAQLAQFEDRVKRLAALRQTIPQVLAKLERGREVILTETAKHKDATNPTNLTDAFDKHHRINKQLTLAALLSAPK